MNDPHYTITPPGCRGEDYGREILVKLHEVAKIAERIGASAVGCTGDWFHRKGKVTFREACALLRVLASWRETKGLDVIGILGNHDIPGHSLGGLDTRAVGSLVHSGTVQLLDYDPYWCGPKGSRFYVTGSSYRHRADASDEGRLAAYGHPPPDKKAVHVHLCHGALIQKGTFFEDYTRADELVELLYENDVCPDILVCGHMHFDEGIKTYYPGGKRVVVCRVGSIGRVSSDDIRRHPRVLVLSVNKTGWGAESFRLKSSRKDLVGAQEKEKRQTESDKNRAHHIEEFVRSFRIEADHWETKDHDRLLAKITSSLGHGEDVLNMAQDAVSKHS